MTPAPLRFWPNVRQTDDCWEWLGARVRGGYGQFSNGEGGRSYAHRWAYEYIVGDIPRGLQLDHLCRNRGCVNPAHLEPVTPRENSQRGFTGRHNSLKTHCPQGHPYDAENTLFNNGRRTCRTCNRDRSRVRMRLVRQRAVLA